MCPLDWGLGHATRMVPIIEMLGRKGANAIIAADNRPLEFLKQRFPQNTFIKFGGFSPIYPSNKWMALYMLRSIPEMMIKARLANKILQKIITNHKIDAVISDNRYELSTPRVPAIFITHQLNIQTIGCQKIGKPIIDKTINYFINKFDELWVPDIPSNFQLSGNLSKTNKFAPKRFNIGLLSRFSKPHSGNNIKSIDILIILSGPEPQRTILEELLLEQALKSKLKIVMLLGKPEENTDKEIKNVKLISHLSDAEFSKLIQSADFVISRPGYSTLMDLAVFGKKAVFIPTPGQTEQEYLAHRLLNEGMAFSQDQNNFKLTEAINNQPKYKGLFIENMPELLDARIDNLLKNC
ncbi:MAG: glycosyltransferase [Bacteroidetes bacterium]|nr:glycosyltransferase [Bacteroidota bacterium]MBL6943440.1 glycosyltransferase [Bacteroidales bacterium]